MPNVYFKKYFRGKIRKLVKEGVSITSKIGWGKILIRGGLGEDLRIVDIFRRGLISHNSVVITLDSELIKSKLEF